MKYRMLRIEHEDTGDSDDCVIYVMPAGSNPLENCIVYDERLEKELKSLLLTHPYSIALYSKAPVDTGKRIRDRLIGMAEKVLERMNNRGRSLFVLGVGIGVLGLINWVIPDPLPVIDEVVLTFGGAALALAGIILRRRVKEEYRNRGEIVKRDILRISVREDPLISSSLSYTPLPSCSLNRSDTKV